MLVYEVNWKQKRNFQRPLMSEKSDNSDGLIIFNYFEWLYYETLKNLNMTQSFLITFFIVKLKHVRNTDRRL